MKTILIFIILIAHSGCSLTADLMTAYSDLSRNKEVAAYTVTFDSQGAAVEASPASTNVVYPETAVGALPSAPSKPGFDFAGWITTTNGGGTVFTATTTVTANITVYAMWSTTGLSFTLINGNTEFGVMKGTAGPNGGITLPIYWSGKPVTSLLNNAFLFSTGLTNFTLPIGLTSIGMSAFSGCSGLTNLSLPDTVVQIGTTAFSGCTGLTNITLPDSLTIISYAAFSGCTGLTNISLPNALTNIGNSAFNGCSGLKSIVLPTGVMTIGDFAFAYCSGLTNVSLQSGVTFIGDNAFNDCSGLKTLIIRSAAAPNIVGTPFSGVTGCTLHIRSSTTGFDVSPWTNTGIFSSIVADLP